MVANNGLAEIDDLCGAVQCICNGLRVVIAFGGVLQRVPSDVVNSHVNTDRGNPEPSNGAIVHGTDGTVVFGVFCAAAVGTGGWSFLNRLFGGSRFNDDSIVCLRLVLYGSFSASMLIGCLVCFGSLSIRICVLFLVLRGFCYCQRRRAFT